MPDDESAIGFAELMSDKPDLSVSSFELRARDLAKESNRGASLTLDETKQIKRSAALGKPLDVFANLKSVQPERYLPQDTMGFKQSGLQEGVYRKLRTGRYDIQARLDLHGMTVDEALKVTLSFIEHSIANQKRCVLIMHGKGVKQAQPARLKNHLASWLKHMPEVMAYHSALANHGGTGCVYVLLRKSDMQRQKNREQFLNAKRPR